MKYLKSCTSASIFWSTSRVCFQALNAWSIRNSLFEYLDSVSHISFRNMQDLELNITIIGMRNSLCRIESWTQFTLQLDQCLGMRIGSFPYLASTMQLLFSIIFYLTNLTGTRTLLQKTMTALLETKQPWRSSKRWKMLSRNKRKENEGRKCSHLWKKEAPENLKMK